MIFFYIKKVISSLLLPLPLLLIAIALGIVCIELNRFQRIGRITILTSWLILTLLSLQPVSNRLLRLVETSHPTCRKNTKIGYIVVLGGRNCIWNPKWAPSSNLTNNSLPRVTEGVRLWLTNTEAKIIFTGASLSSNVNSISIAEAYARVAESLGVPRNAIITLNSPKNTEEEAEAVKKAIGDSPFLLVTSASHLPRAMIFFQRKGLHPLPAPANQLAINTQLNLWERIIPSPLWLIHSDLAVYEIYGRIWQWAMTNR